MVAVWNTASTWIRIAESCHSLGASKVRRYQATPRYSTTAGSTCQVRGTRTWRQALVVSSVAYQRCSSPTFRGSVRNHHWPHRLTVSCADESVLFAPAARVGVLMVPTARAPA